MSAFDHDQRQRLENGLDLAHLRAVQSLALFASLNRLLNLDEDSEAYGLLQLGLEVADRAVDDLAEMVANVRALQPDAPEVQP
jgi:hypothetical protein